MAESPTEEQTELENNVIEASERFLTKKAPGIEEKEMIPYVFANDKNNPVPFGLLDLFYQGVFTNTVGIMIAKDSETGNEELVLVGLAKDANGEPVVYPMAVCIGQAQTGRYLPPDGKGGYVELPAAE